MNTNTPAPDYSVTSFSTVVVEKDKLLAKLRENRDNHNTIYLAACSGYWQKCATVLEEKKTDFTKASDKLIKQFNDQYTYIKESITSQDKSGVTNFSVALGFHSVWPLAHPVNHLEDYDRVINMLEFSVADKVSLSSDDFDAYVRNNWTWKEQFVNSNLFYVRSVTGCMFSGGTLNGGESVISTSNAAYAFAVSGMAYS